MMRRIFKNYGIPEVLHSDGGREFTRKVFQDFLKKWCVKHRQSSAYHPHSNLRAEVGVKVVKKLVTNNLGRGGTLHSDDFSLALMNYRNTPLRGLNKSPAQLLFSRKLKDGLPCTPDNLKLHPKNLITDKPRSSTG